MQTRMSTGHFLHPGGPSATTKVLVSPCLEPSVKLHRRGTELHTESLPSPKTPLELSLATRCHRDL